jgi:hypothetical protein
VFRCQRGHFSGNLQVALKWPFNVNSLARNDAWAYCLEMSIHPYTADDEIYIIVGSEIYEKLLVCGSVC